MAGGVDPTEGWVADVTPERVHALLLQRAPRLLDAGSTQQQLFLQHVAGVASEVLPLVAADSTNDSLRHMASWAVVLGVAANVEEALFPEQQLGDDSRAASLRARYLGVLASLRAMPGILPTAGGALPAGRFPAVPCPAYPDPALGRRGLGYRHIVYPSGVVVP